MENGLEGAMLGILAGPIQFRANNIINRIIELKKSKENNVKTIALEEIFNNLKEKIDKYDELIKKSGNLELNNSEVIKIEEEIRNLKSKIDELNLSIEGKSKIEKMKITLNITSLESEISLKNIDLENEIKKTKTNYEKKVENSNKNLENLKNNLITYIQNREKDLEMSIKMRNIFNNQTIIIDGVELKRETIEKLKNLGLNNPLDLINFNLTSNDLEDLMKVIDNLPTEVFINEVKRRNLILEGNELFIGVLEINRLHNLKKKLEPLFDKKILNIILGTDLEEVKNYYDNIMKVELLNLENIEKEEVTITGEEKKKLEIKKEAIQSKINTVNEMVDEMIKEVIKEELKKREIVIPSFVPVTKYFNTPDEVEE